MHRDLGEGSMDLCVKFGAARSPICVQTGAKAARTLRPKSGMREERERIESKQKNFDLNYGLSNVGLMSDVIHGWKALTLLFPMVLESRSYDLRGRSYVLICEARSSGRR